MQEEEKNINETDEMQEEIINFSASTPGDILEYQIFLLQKLQKINFIDLYDEHNEDKIKCVRKCFKVIEAAQEAQLRELEVM